MFRDPEQIESSINNLVLQLDDLRQRQKRLQHPPDGLSPEELAEFHIKAGSILLGIQKAIAAIEAEIERAKSEQAAAESSQRQADKEAELLKLDTAIFELGQELNEQVKGIPKLLHKLQQLNRERQSLERNPNIFVDELIPYLPYFWGEVGGGLRVKTIGRATDPWKVKDPFLTESLRISRVQF